MTSPADLGLVQALRELRAGRLRSADLMEACLERISRREHDVQAWEHLDPAAALAQAHAADRAGCPGCLGGIPLAVKDIIDTVDMPTGHGSPIYRGHQPDWDAACVALARREGALLMGKTVTTEFAYFRPGKTRNPHHVGHTPGGSSSGSAAAVASGMVPAAFGTQTAASVIRPAAYCGVVGYKSSHGHFSLAGIKPFAMSLDSLGLFARHVEDVQWLRAALLRIDPERPRPQAPRAPRITVCRTPSWPEAGADARAALETAARRLAQGGAQVDEASLPPVFDRLVDVQKTVMAYEAASALAFEYDRHREQLSQQIIRLIEDGMALPRQAYLDALAEAKDARAQFQVWMAGRDAVLAPSATGEAPAGLHATGDPVFSRLWTLLHAPCINLPGLTGSQGLPVGVQLVASTGADEYLLDVARLAQPLLT